MIPNLHYTLMSRDYIIFRNYFSTIKRILIISSLFLFPVFNFVFLAQNYVPDPSQKFNRTCYPLFSMTFRRFGVKKCLIPFLRNKPCSVNFCNYEPILMKFSKVILLTSG